MKGLLSGRVAELSAIQQSLHGAAAEAVGQPVRNARKLLASVSRSYELGAPVTEEVWQCFAELLDRPCVVVKHDPSSENDQLCLNATEYCCKGPVQPLDSSRVSSRFWVLQDRQHFQLLLPREDLRLGRREGFPDNEFVVLNAGSFLHPVGKTVIVVWCFVRLPDSVLSCFCSLQVQYNTTSLSLPHMSSKFVRLMASKNKSWMR